MIRFLMLFWGHENFINEDYYADDLLHQLGYPEEKHKRKIKTNKKGTEKLLEIF